ncbi:DUF4355 domain-containing protein [Lysinibacillus sphaericus]|uniref:Ribonuclease phage-like protein n=1 Tax=Lysinibacillus sphaericus TaxID=1421 RepID=A0A2S0K6C5_LYSSH|nr:DUF4355 domain-containing protein [Lysinibacillus sphaericus]AVK98849.1 hypothetical protein LS41612_22440 [Lysinibacillus sphaericus]MED4545288.1 DUF4355 domain-containing protein [Lysinibacillus sphaericus]TKI18349.1 DUF4355 domain-containing protein [Lysinibacillus sphaericus]SUV15134.1 ribonuclease phage-like protein [Lysinibacillus sphaericus]GEC82205.1 hypothetical protein LSP03_19480 [Lysinibacillus sphaericus]
MKINLDKLKELVEAGDVSAIEKHVLEESLEKGDLSLAVKANKDVKSEFESERDKYHSKALETWKSNNLETLIEEEVNKRNPQETPEQKTIRELKERLDAQEKEAKRSAMKETALTYATDKGYDVKFATKWIDKLLGDDETVTNTTLDEFKTDFDAVVQAQVDSKFKELGRDIDKPGGGSSSVTNLSELASAANIRK